MEDLRYPIGQFQWKVGDQLSDAQRRELIGQVEQAPARMRAAVAGLSEKQLDTPYREGGWSVRQVAHHVPDSHLNAYIRFKLTLTEQEPTIKAYDQERWAQLEDTRSTPVEVSVALLENLHRRWVVLLRSMQSNDFQRNFRHPEKNRLMTLDETLALYAWHGRHHVAHVTLLRERMGWNGSGAKL